jgi:hypothetical protein
MIATMTVDTTSKHAIVVTGDVIVDHHLYEGERRHPSSSTQTRGVHQEIEPGGAALVSNTLKELFKKDAGIDTLTDHSGRDGPTLGE